MPFKSLSVFALVTRQANTARILAKNFAVVPKGLWLAKVATE